MDSGGRTALDHAMGGSHLYLSRTDKQSYIDTCLILLDSGTNRDPGGRPVPHNYICQAAAKNLYTIFDALLDRGFDKDLGKSAGYLLCSAAKFGRRDRVKQLLDWDADVNAPGYEKSTALHQAARTKDLEMCRLLIAHGADVNAKDVRGQTPLFEVFDRWAIHLKKYLTASPDVTQANALAVLQLLLENGADPSAKASSTTSTSHSGTVLGIFHNMPKAFRDALKKTDRD